MALSEDQRCEIACVYAVARAYSVTERDAVSVTANRTCHSVKTVQKYKTFGVKPTDVPPLAEAPEARRDLDDVRDLAGSVRSVPGPASSVRWWDRRAQQRAEWIEASRSRDQRAAAAYRLRDGR